MLNYSQAVKKVIKTGNYSLLFKVIPYPLIAVAIINTLLIFFNLHVVGKKLLIFNIVDTAILLLGALYFLYNRKNNFLNILLYETILALCFPIYQFTTLVHDISIWYLYGAVIFGGLFYGLLSGYFLIPVAWYPILCYLSYQLSFLLFHKDVSDVFKSNLGISIVMWFSAIATSAVRIGFDIYYLFRVALREQALELASVRKLKESTEQKLALEQELNKLKSVETLGLNAGGIAHDFNNMLTIIAGQMMSLRRTATDEFEQKRIETIMMAVKKTSDLIKKLLLFTGQYDSHSQVFSLNEIIESTVELLRHGSNRKIEIKSIISEDIAHIHGDSNLFQTLLISFLYNVIKCLETDSVLSINLTLLDEYRAVTPGNLRIEAVPPEKIAVISIYCKFQDNQTWQKNGTFFELISIINVMNGKLITGKDVIQINLPLSKKKFSDSEQANNSLENNKEILIIDDDRMVLKSTEEVLLNAGYRVIACNDAGNAVKTFRRKYKEIGLVLLDMRMPDRSGKELYFDLKRIDPHVKVIIVSGYCSDIDVQEMLNDGVLEYVEKPYTEEVLCKKVALFI